MKRLLGLVVLFVVLSVSVPSYGFFLLYNVSGSAKGVNNSTPASIPWKAYLVLNIDPSSYALVDANLIMYGKDISKIKVYVEHNYSNSDESLSADFWSQGDFFAFDFWTMTTPFNFEGFILGKMALKDIGLGTSTKKWVASSMKGNFMVWGDMLLDADDDMAGVGTVSASLNLAATKYVNLHAWTQDQIIEVGSPDHEGLIPMLETKEYVAATLP